MNLKDKRLGMDRSISRRDFLNGTAITIGAAMLPVGGAQALFPEKGESFYYPPAATGLRGSHPGSFENAHAAVQGKTWQAEQSGEHYDLVVVGGGISGLSSAYMYLRDVKPDARILILDNHDDFGGHAKRNEFTVDGKTLIGFGGTMMIDEMKHYPKVSLQVMREIGMIHDTDAPYNHTAELREMGLGRATFFDKETFGADVLVKGRRSFEDAPLSDTTKQQLKTLYADEIDYMDGMSDGERDKILNTLSYKDYLQKFVGVNDEVLTFMQKRPHGVWAIGIDALPAWMAKKEGYPGFKEEDDVDEFGNPVARQQSGYPNFRFPDGNASIARLLVRKLVPGVATGTSIDDVVAAKFDYSVLDKPSNQTRIRLSSTAVNMRHKGADNSGDVEITYVNNDQAKTVTATKAIWAGYHALLPYVCDEFPEEQVDAFVSSVRAPLVYISVAVKNWRSLANLGVSRISCPGAFCQSIGLSHPVSFGDYKFATNPDEPTVLHMQYIPTSPGLPAAQQFRAGRNELLTTAFETMERKIRDQMKRVLGPGGFDPARDIAGITVNRWPHGYAYSVDPETGDVGWYPDEYWRHESKPWVNARKRHGNIAIAGTDAASNAMTESAIEEAHRAVQTLKS